MSPMMSFSQRIRSHPRIGSPTPASPNAPLVLAVKNQLLVGASIADPHNPQNHSFLQALSAYAPVLLTSLFEGMPAKHVENVNVYELKLPAGTDIFQATAALRAVWPPAAPERRKVSPNHVMIPAPELHGCPYGPPSPTTASFTLPAGVPKSVPVTVIDSGYQWKTVTGATPAWPPNPLAGHVVEHEAEQLPPALGPWQPGTPDVTPAQWQASTHENVSPESLTSPAGPRLDALAGHANFVAGVIAHGTAHAAITIRNHNGAFHPTSDDLPTEATVARSLVRSTGAQVVNIGFAFVAFDDVVSWIWDSAFQYIGPTPVVVAPAGNQGSSVRRYPAALNDALPGLFPQMIGVASTTPPSGDADAYSNHGPWVTCSADGSGVVSTFLHVNQALEDGDELSHDFTTNSLASWNGTSFAAPKVAAAICEAIATTGEQPMLAWAKVRGTGQNDPNYQLGWRLTL
jgi:hypothetical protein